MLLNEWGSSRNLIWSPVAKQLEVLKAHLTLSLHILRPQSPGPGEAYDEQTQMDDCFNIFNAPGNRLFYLCYHI